MCVTLRNKSVMVLIEDRQKDQSEVASMPLWCTPWCCTPYSRCAIGEPVPQAPFLSQQEQRLTHQQLVLFQQMLSWSLGPNECSCRSHRCQHCSPSSKCCPSCPLAITPENLPTGRILRKSDYVMLSSDCCSHKCNHVSLARLCNDELWEGAWGGIVSVWTLWLRQFQPRLSLMCLLQCLLQCETPLNTVMHHHSQCSAV